jgi:hypothetical protein
MRSGKLVACAVTVAALLTACASGGDTGNATGGGETPPQESAAPPKPTKFEDFPGQGLVYLESGTKVGVKLKAIDATWTGDMLGNPADPDKHYLQVWVVVTPELADRGAQKIRLARQLYVRYKPGRSGCDATSTGYCHTMGWPGSQLSTLDTGETWRTESWQQSEYVADDIPRGETQFGTIGFPIEDTVDTTEFELCAPSKEEGYNNEKFPCVPIKTPDGTR